MCLTDGVPASRLARISEAIDQLAAEAASGAAGGPEQLSRRLAAIWEMVADADPGLARRLRGYSGDSEDATDPGNG
ncbi:MAG TPA: hypothetical protein VE343_15800 [Streptosporangiaceae bacterium]|nr:hypothetical protein [Streptosporangiaceae bacterium]